MPCTDPPPVSPLDCAKYGRHTSGFGSAGANKDDVRDVLCPGLQSLHNASCNDILDEFALAPLLAPIARVPVCCKLGWSGLVDAKRQAIKVDELARVLAFIGGHAHHSRAHLTGASALQPLRFLSTESGNCWVSLVVAAYLQRVHGGPLAGFAVGPGKSEWTMAGDTRKLLQAEGLSFRGESAFMLDPAANAAWLARDPQPRSSVMPTAYTNASARLPRWRGKPPPFDVCVRVGVGATFLRKRRRRLAESGDRTALLSEWCRVVALVKSGGAADGDQEARALDHAAFGEHARLHRMGGSIVAVMPSLEPFSFVE